MATVLYGSTAEVILSGRTATKVYFPHVSQRKRRWEVDTLEELGCALTGVVRVPDLLSVEYDGDEILSITTQRVEGLTLKELRLSGLYTLANRVVKAVKAEAPLVVDLETDGNIRVEIDNDQHQLTIWLVDVGDQF